MILNGKTFLILILLMQQIPADSQIKRRALGNAFNGCREKQKNTITGAQQQVKSTNGKCDSTGKTMNSETCRCGKNFCEQGTYCLVDRCGERRMCDKGIVENSSCYCTKHVTCEMTMFCAPDDTEQMFCYPQCKDDRGTDTCEMACGCGEKLCAQYEFCHENHCEKHPTCTSYEMSQPCACKELTNEITSPENVCSTDQFCHHDGCHKRIDCVPSLLSEEPCICKAGQKSFVCLADEYCFPDEPNVSRLNVCISK